MVWTLLLLLTVGWLLTLLAGVGPPWSRALPAVIGALNLPTPVIEDLPTDGGRVARYR